MEGISELKIIGIDETRPPAIRKEPYINLFFKLSMKPPKAWCDEFNGRLSKAKFPAKITHDNVQIIETWVRKPEEIEDNFETLKKGVAASNLAYIARIEAETRASADKEESDSHGEQGKLNRIIAGLDFS